MSATRSSSTAARRPCLKHSTSSPPPFYRCLSSKASPNSSRVHFPPTPALSTTFPTHSKNTYDRRPLVVQPNACAIPARGCPGRTYVLERATSHPGTKREHESLADVVAVREPGDDILDIAIQDEDEDEDGQDSSFSSFSSCWLSHPPSPSSSSSTVTPSTPRPRTFPTALPPLIPDHGPSSSESDESDTITSPNGPYFLSPSGFQPMVSSLHPAEDSRLGFLPHPPAPDARSIDRDREKERESRRRRREERGRWKTDIYIAGGDSGMDAGCLGGF